MKQISTLLLISLFFISCKKENQINVIQKTTVDTITKIKADSVAKPKIVSADSLEAIEKENAGMILGNEENIQKAYVRKDSLIWLNVDMKRDHRIFGYEKPDSNSKKMLLISIFTNDVQNNPFHLPYGAFYDTSEIKLKFIENKGDFAKVELLNDDTVKVIYFENKWLEFE
ncbi:hypothetical protein AR687_06130 [Flavobacteriaceae bacterium CRH]|nr:hypothetical protein AR687_06130 [Flavobacteriaceae bacterium CRH]